MSVADVFRRAERVMPGGVSSPVRALRAVADTPLVIARGEGAFVEDDDGQRFVDFIGSWGAAIAGHAHPLVVDAVARAAHDGLGFGATHRFEVDLAEEVVARIPGAELVRFVSSGTEAVMSALRLARAATNRTLVVKFDGGYHGHADVVLARPGSGAATLRIPAIPGIPQTVLGSTISLPFNDVEAVDELFRMRGHEVACVIVEPVAGNMGVVPAEPSFLKSLRDLTRSHGALLVFDEVITGFRVARGGAQLLTGVSADLVTLGKVLGGGLPIGAYTGSRELMSLVAPVGPVYQAGTLAGNPVAMAAGLATLRLLDAGAYTQLEQLGARAASGLAAAWAAAGIPAQVQRIGSMFTVFAGSSRPVRTLADAHAADHEAFAAWFRGMRRHGVLLPPSGYEALFIGLSHTDSHIDAAVAASRRVLEE
ncbi:MAG: glutamate-1-semialdehyde 2,1-aminomutase [Gemmatimonadota bacterium]